MDVFSAHDTGKYRLVSVPGFVLDGVFISIRFSVDTLTFSVKRMRVAIQQEHKKMDCSTHCGIWKRHWNLPNVKPDRLDAHVLATIPHKS